MNIGRQEFSFRETRHSAKGVSGAGLAAKRERDAGVRVGKLVWKFQPSGRRFQELPRRRRGQNGRSGRGAPARAPRFPGSAKGAGQGGRHEGPRARAREEGKGQGRAWGPVTSVACHSKGTRESREGPEPTGAPAFCVQWTGREGQPHGFPPTRDAAARRPARRTRVKPLSNAAAAARQQEEAGSAREAGLCAALP